MKGVDPSTPAAITGLPKETLLALGEKIAFVPSDFAIHPRLATVWWYGVVYDDY